MKKRDQEPGMAEKGKMTGGIRGVVSQGWLKRKRKGG
jgi:hypothetical protein